MKKNLGVLTLTCTLLLISVHISAAPIPPVGPFDISGTIGEIQWVPEQQVPGQPGFSGSLGRDRLVPAHFVVLLVNFSGVDANNAVRMSRYIIPDAYGNSNPSGMPPYIILKLNFKDSNFLSVGKKIKVRGYVVRGDEGGTWTFFTGISMQ
jgi:hypothetical protein